MNKLLFIHRLLICLFFLILFATQAFGEDRDNEILVIGTGTIEENNLAEARKLAISNAHIKGIEAYLVKILGRQGMINNFTNIINEIIPGSDDVIENYDIRAEDKSSKTYKLLVSIKVNEKLMEEKLRNSGIVLYEGASLRVLFLISDRTNRYETPFIWWDAPEYKTNLSSAELVLHRLFQERGFDPVNRLTNVPEGGYNPELFKEDLSDEEAAEWGRLFSADVVILGKVDVNNTNTMVTNLKAIQVLNTSVLATYNNKEIIEDDPETAVTTIEIQEKMLTNGVAKIIPDILRVFKKEEEKLSRFTIELKGLDSLKQVMAFITFIREKITGVESVVQTRITHGTISMSVEFSGAKETFADKVKRSPKMPFAAYIVFDETGSLIVTAK